MEFVWVLTICGGLSGWGCGAVTRSPMPSHDACIKQMEMISIKSTVGEKSSVDDGSGGYVTCQLLSVDDGTDGSHYRMKTKTVPKSWRFTDG